MNSVISARLDGGRRSRHAVPTAAMAVLVRANRRGSVFFRTAFFLPFIVGLATESFMLLLELQPDSGAADYVLSKLGLAHANTA